MVVENEYSNLNIKVLLGYPVFGLEKLGKVGGRRWLDLWQL
jgi:hypothetical protein